MAKIPGIFCLNVLLLTSTAILVNGEKIVKKSIELNELSNGTTSTIRVEPNQNITIACFNQGYNRGNLGWFLDSTRLETEDQRSDYASVSSLSLKMPQSEPTNRIYTCRTENLGNLLSANVEIIVQEEELEQFYVEVTEKSSSLPQELNVPSTKSAAELNCFLQGVDPSKVGWYFDAFRLPTEDFKDGFASFSKLKIPIEELSSSGRKFTCRSEESGAILFATVTVRAEEKGGERKIDCESNPGDGVSELPGLNNAVLGAIIAIWTVAILLLIALICLIVKRLSKNQPQGDASSPSCVEDGTIITDPSHTRNGTEFVVDSSAPAVHGAKHKSFTSKSNYRTNIAQFTVNSIGKPIKGNYNPIPNNV